MAHPPTDAAEGILSKVLPMNPTDPVTAWQRYVVDGGVMMFGLVPVALLAVAYVVQGFINLRRARVVPRDFPDRLRRMAAAAPDRRALASVLETDGSSIAVVVGRVLRHLEFKPDADPVALLEDCIVEECDALQRRNNHLAALYTVAPLMGLLGTVLGMLQTFHKFALSETPSVTELSRGINVAFITTAWGLGIAVPCVIFLQVFARRIAGYEEKALPREGVKCLEIVLPEAIVAPKAQENH